jgi:putative ATP-dependent endonuclease of OLD family
MVSTISAASQPASLMRIEVVRIRTFRGIRECVLTLRPKLTVLVGRNNSGKSRLLRAIALACGSVNAERDDFTVGSDEEPTIELVLAPAGSAPSFDDRVREVFGTHIQLVSASGDERIAWRTSIARSAEGWGARATSRFLMFDAGTDEWRPASGASELSRAHRRVLAADMTGTGRDLAGELSRPGTSIRRVLDDLEVPEAARGTLEADLQVLGGRIVDESSALGAVRERLSVLAGAVSGIGSPHVSALPGRLEELVRLIDIALDTGAGAMPMRLHGAGARSLASLQVQSVLYDRRLGRDGSDFPIHPVTLIEEPEAHLHPQACFDLADLLSAVPGQIVVSTHSSHLVTVAELGSLRLIRRTTDGCIVHDMTPSDVEATKPPALRLDVAEAEWEKIRRYVERPFGELLFAGALVIGDGASERGFLPHILRAALGPRADEICVVDPGGMSQSDPLIKYAEAAGIPCVVFLDCDDQGHKDEKKIRSSAIRVWATGDPAKNGALEEVLVEHDEEWVLARCTEHLSFVEGSALERLKQLKGTYGSPLGRAFVEAFPDPTAWPAGLRHLVEALGPTTAASGDANA